MAVDLGVGYISLVPSTKDFDKGIKGAFGQAVKHADKAGADMGDSVVGHLAKAGLTAGDRFGKGFSGRMSGAGRAAIQNLSQFLVGSATGIGSEMGGKISGGLARSLSRGADDAVAVLGGVGSKGGSTMASSLATYGALAAGSVALIATAAVGVTAKLYEIGTAFDDISDGITAKTGKIGDELNAITDSVKSVALDTAAALPDIGAIAAQLVQTLKLSGKDLETLTEQVANYNEMNKDAPLNVREFAKAVKQYGMTSVTDMTKLLDELNNVSQGTGIPLNDLISTMRRLGPAAKEFNLPLTSVIQVITSFEEAGLDFESSVMMFRTALGKIASEFPGQDPAAKLREIVTQIKDLIAAGKDAEAIDLAKTFFGGRGFQQIIDLIRQGKLDIDNINTSIAGLGPTINEQRQATEDFAEEWQKFKNFLTVELEPAATLAFRGINLALQSTLGLVADNIRSLREFFNTITESPNANFGSVGEPGVPGIVGDGAAGTAIAPPSGVGGAPPNNPFNPGGIYGNIPGMPGTAGRGYMNYGRASAYLDAQAADRALLSQVPSGVYTQTGAADLTRGLADCSSAIEDLVNIIDGRPTAGRSLSTYNANQWLMSRGFQPGTRPGAFNVGFNSGHMAATLPGGTPFDWGTSAAAARGGVGGAGAFDPAFTGHYYRYASGGRISGPGGPRSDSILARVSNGEYIVQAAAANKHYPLLEAINSGRLPGMADGGLVDPNMMLQNRPDPNTTVHGQTDGAPPGPDQQQQQPDPLQEFLRTSGFTPVAAGNTGVAGTSFVSGLLNLGNEAVSGLIDTGASLAQTAVSAAITAGVAGGTMGAAAPISPAAGAAGSAAASYGIQLGASVAKRLSSYGFQMAGIGADSLIAQMFPFGAPRWLGYDYTQLAPRLGLQQAALGGLQQAGSAAINQAFGVNQQRPANPASPESATPHSPGGPPGPAPVPAPLAGVAPPMPTPPEMLGFDSGGMLPPNTLALNTTGRPEPVLTPQQWESLSNVPAPGQQPLVKIDAIYGLSPEDVASKIESKQKLAMMRYAGRP